MNAAVIKVLLTEDEPSFADIIRIILDDADQVSFEVDWVPDLKTCLASLNDNKYDILLLDLHLPDSFGLDTVATVKKQYPDIPIVAMTGLKEDALAQGALQAGAQDFFEKTELTGKQLVRIIQCATDRRALELKLERHAEELEGRVRERTRQLQHAKDQWERTFDVIPDFISILDLDFKIIRTNKALAKALNMHPREVVGRRCYELMHGTEEPIEGCPHVELLKDHKEHIKEVFVPSLNADFLISTTPLHDDKGQLMGSVYVCRDITHFKESQQAIADSERQHRMFMDRLPDPTVVYSNEGEVVYANAAFEQVFGWSLDELIDRKLDFVPPVAFSQTHKKIKQMMQGEPVKNFITERSTKNGKKLNVRIDTAPIVDAEGNRAGNIVIIRDITALRQAEAAQRASDRRFRTLVETMNEGLTMVDPDGGIVYTNAKFRDILGYQPFQFKGKAFVDLLDEQSKEVFFAQSAMSRTGEEKSYEAVLKSNDGGSIYAIVSPKTLKDGRGKVLGGFAVITDITKRKILESQLLQSHKLEGIGQLAAGIAHEINTPTQYVSSNTGFLEEAFSDLQELMNAHTDLVAKLKETGVEQGEVARLEELAQELDFEFLAEEIPQALSANRDGLERIAKIVLSIKEFAHPGQEDKQLANLNKAIENTITVARNEWKYVADVETDLDPELPPVPCVVGEINQVILNLIVNASHAIGDCLPKEEKAKGLIAIRSRFDADWAEIQVEDNGPGIPEALRSRIFEPFFTTKDPGKGTGQGLSIAYRAIVNKHHGELTVDSGEGGGTRFTIRLPFNEKGVE